jgi:hypothetical protein
MAAETAAKPRATRRARKTATTRRKPAVPKPDPAIGETADELYAEAEGMAGLSDGMIARLSGAWGETNAKQIGVAVQDSGRGERMREGFSMAELDWLLQQRGSRSWQDGHVSGYTSARQECELRERHVRREVLLGALSMWRTELEQILKVASRPGAPADERRKEALDALVQHTADVARQQGRLEEEAFGR